MATINESLCYRTRMFIPYSFTQIISSHAKFQLLFSLGRLVCPLHFNPIALQNEIEVILIFKIQVKCCLATPRLVVGPCLALSIPPQKHFIQKYPFITKNCYCDFFSSWPFNCIRFLSRATQLEEYFCLILGNKLFVLHEN